MIKSDYKVIGVMSGTSLDGIDLAYITFRFADKVGFEIQHAETVAYSNTWRKQLSKLTEMELDDLKRLDNSYTVYLSEVINNFIKTHRLDDVDAICSHGHTALHRPQDGLTYQIGNLPVLAELTNHKVVCDFRVQDVKLGGQGAPLVPIGDQLLFSNYDYCINLGGFANISFEEEGLRIAYDICPVNTVLNYYAELLGESYDAEGKIAASGKVDQTLLQQLNELPFYKMSSPKSLGLEWVKHTVLPIIDTFDLAIPDVIATFTEHVAVQIAAVVHKDSKILCTGGGTYNTYLLSRIEHLKDIEITHTKKNLIEFKEALIFGLLGVLKLRDAINCLASVTGACHDHSSGEIYNP
ncbi:anhydro-N-acetylmuramic acid kinase [Sediminibacter sp. Hel_I_10]|uniref:anhydro-N-acetylmuramic acid kinase n=1 Tax=Sediminibacter sp. Hel_I_10 TaxID=1392490 RepID=UPI00047E3F5E|nr:anhydro-N-acetylmuramic acid kinase [Sediminibacter sp. Hel_I_10]